MHVTCFSISGFESLAACIEKWNLTTHVIDQAGQMPRVCLPSILSLVERALGKRIQMLAVKPRPAKQVGICFIVGIGTIDNLDATCKMM